MWELLVSLLAEDDQDIVVDSSLLPIKAEPSYYVWKDTLSLDGVCADLYLSFQLVLHGARMEVLRVTIPKIDIVHNAYLSRKQGRRRSIYGYMPFEDTQRVMDLKERVSINYRAFRYDKGTAQMHIQSVTAHFDGAHLFKIIHTRGHKVVALVNDVYLGRPQRIEGPRHQWMPAKEEKPFDVSPRSQHFEAFLEETRDMIILRKNSDRISPACDIVQSNDIVWDSDAFSNPLRRLPVVVRHLKLIVYDLGTLPPHSVEYNVSWGDFVVDYLNQTNRMRVLRESTISQRFLVPPDESVAGGIRLHVGTTHIFVRYYMLTQKQRVLVTNITFTRDVPRLD